MICDPCKNNRHMGCKDCTCQHKTDRPMSAKYIGLKDDTLPITPPVDIKGGWVF